MNKTIFMAAVLAVSTVLAAGLTVLPGSIQEAQANPCATENVVVEIPDPGGVIITQVTPDNDERECTILGNDIDFEED
jgi:hypothetical protein